MDIFQKVGDCYTKFNLAHTSKSTANMKAADRFFKKIVLTSQESRSLDNASFRGGSLVHLIVQEVLTKKITLDEALFSPDVQRLVDSYTPFNEKDSIKFQFIYRFAKPQAQNHLDNIKEVEDIYGKQKWVAEEQKTLWTPPVQTYWLMYIDLVSKKVLGDFKNKFGTVSNKPLKQDPKNKKKDKVTNNRIGDWVYTHQRIEKRPYFSDVMQVSLYKKAVKVPPFLSYATATERKLFTEHNCDELKEENLTKALNVLKIYEIAWQKKLEAADGDVKKLAWLCVPDFSDMKKKGWGWDNVPDEFIERFKSYYV